MLVGPRKGKEVQVERMFQACIPCDLRCAPSSKIIVAVGHRRCDRLLQAPLPRSPLCRPSMLGSGARLAADLTLGSLGPIVECTLGA
eukprot:scaffold307727_cov27-Tisochrysis_lutea.AAC.1